MPPSSENDQPDQNARSTAGNQIKQPQKHHDRQVVQQNARHTKTHGVLGPAVPDEIGEQRAQPAPE